MKHLAPWIIVAATIGVLLNGCSNLAQEGCTVGWNVTAGGLVTGTTSGSCAPVASGTTVVPASPAPASPSK